ncbi:MAG: DNA-directed RNA polymerase subunit alpha [Gemmatimonadota bacterium]
MSVAVDLTGLVLPEKVEELSRSEDGRRAQFVLQPLERGFGHTIGNSIRRILLSSLPGAAVWAFRADGVQHEHQTIGDVAEDVHQVVQNLKRLVLKLDPEYETANLELSAHKSGPVRASQISKQAGVTIVSPKRVLFTLQEDLPESRPLRVDLWVNRGRGFRMADQHQLSEDERKEAPVGQILIDSIYNPVVKANFTVQETRVGERTDFDRLILDVETNGALDPEEAVRQAAEIARAHLAYLTRFGELPEAVAADGDGGPATPEEEMRLLLEQPLESFEEISSRSRNTLEKQDITTLADVASRTRDEMLSVPHFGEKSLEEVAEVLAAHGLHFGMFPRGEETPGEAAEEPSEDGTPGSGGDAT